MVITRNSGLPHGTGSTDGGSPGKLFGYGADTQSRFGGNNALPFEILKHEFNHLLIGGNNFHSGGGNASQFESYQRLVRMGWGHRKTAIAEYGLMLLVALSALAMLRMSGSVQLLSLFCWVGIYALLMWRIDQAWKVAGRQ